MQIYIIWKKTHPQKMLRHFTTEKTVQNWKWPILHIYINLWTFVDLCSFFGAFLDSASHVFLNLFEIIFPKRGHSTIFEKIDFVPILGADSWGTNDTWHLKKQCHKKMCKNYLSIMATSGKCTKKMKHFCKITPSPPNVWHLLMNLKNNYLLKKLLKWASKKSKNFNIYKVVFFKKMKNTWRYHYFTPVSQKSWKYDLEL